MIKWLDIVEGIEALDGLTLNGDAWWWMAHRAGCSRAGQTTAMMSDTIRISVLSLGPAYQG